MPLSHKQTAPRRIHTTKPSVQQGRDYWRRDYRRDIEKDYLSTALFDMSVASTLNQTPAGFDSVIRDDKNLTPTSLKEAQVHLLCWRYIAREVSERLSYQFDLDEHLVKIERGDRKSRKGYTEYVFVAKPKIDEPLEEYALSLIHI